MKRNEILRLCVLCVLWTLAAASLLCEGDDVAGVLAVKAVGILVGVASWMIGRYWMDDGSMPWTEEIIREE